MKKYHLADVLTALEFIMAAILTGMIFLKTSANWALWVFVGGELCDAFDGICARRWPYPDDGKYRWWRVPRTVQALEHVSDIWLVGACGIYLARCAIYPLNYVVLILGIGITGSCAITEILIRSEPHYRIGEILHVATILQRRKVYLAGVTIGIIALILSTTWPIAVKLALIAIGTFIGILLAKKKSDRLNNI